MIMSQLPGHDDLDTACRLGTTSATLPHLQHVAQRFDVSRQHSLHVTLIA